MASSIALVTDSTCNLHPDMAAKHHIYVAPLYVLWGEKSYRDGVDLTDEELFRRLRGSDDIPKTSQVSPKDFVELFEHARHSESASEVVCGVLSSDLSGTYASAIQAREMVDFPVRVIDTRQTSWALGFSMLAAAQARDQGRSTEEIVSVIEDTARRSRLLFTIESLDYLYKGGRIGNASRLLGSALNIKPILELKDGVIESLDKVRTRKRATDHMVKSMAQYAAGRPINRVAAIHGDVKDEAEAILARVVEEFQPRETYLSLATAVLGVHVGPGTLGLLFEFADA